jgi:hypothetical protein
MHVDTAYQIAMAGKPALLARPVAVLRFMPVITHRAMARRSSFRSGNYRDATQFQLVGQVVYVFAIFPFGHAVIMCVTAVFVSDSLGITDVDLADAVSLAELNNPARGFMPQVPDLTAGLRANTPLRTDELLVAARTFPTLGQTTLDLASGLLSIPLDRTNPAARNNQARAGVGGNGAQVDLAQVDSRVSVTRGRGFGKGPLRDMQLKAIIPNERYCSCLLDTKRKDKRLSAFAHRENQLAVFYLDGLSGPRDGIEGFCAPGILELLVTLAAMLAGGVYVGDKRLTHPLNRLTMKLSAAFGGTLQSNLSGPRVVGLSRFQVKVFAGIPNPGTFHLCGFQSLKRSVIKVFEVIDLSGLHTYN